MKKYFLTFGGGPMTYLHAVDRLAKQAESLKIFDEIYGLKENDLKSDHDFWNKHGEFLIYTRGFGYWLWKPYLIKKIYDKMEEGDVLMYCDCGNELDIRKRESILKLFDIVEKDLLLGSYPGKTKDLDEINWCKSDLLHYLHVENDSEVLHTTQRQPGALVILKCARTKYLINDWCVITNNNYHLIDDSPSERPNHECFIEHRHDQSVFSILSKKYNLFSEKTVENEIDILRNATGNSRIVLDVQILRSVTRENIVIFGKSTNKDTRGAGYNMGDLLNMPYLSNVWNATPHQDVNCLERMYIVGNDYKDSIVSNYIETRPLGETIPCIPRVIEATEKYTHNCGQKKDPEVFKMVQDDTTLCVHVRCGDKMVEANYIDLIERMSHTFKTVYLFSGIHLDEHFKSNDEKMINFVETLNVVLGKNTNIYLVLCEPDMHVSLMSKAKHLLLHSGGFSTIGSIVCTEGKLYATGLFGTMFCENWKREVNKPITMLEI